MGSQSKRANYVGYRKNTKRNTNIKKWEKLLKNGNQKSDAFLHQIQRNLEGK